jgi:hypothetical protein
MRAAILKPKADKKAPTPKRSTVTVEQGKSFVQCMDDEFKDWFQPASSWRAWRIVAKCIFAEELTVEEIQFYREHTGREYGPTTTAREVWLEIGRRGGKNWFTAALIVYLACIRKVSFKMGELGRVMLLAADQDQADIAFSYIETLIDGNAEWAAMVVKRSKQDKQKRIELSNRVEILIKPGDKRRVRGRTLLAAICDEIAHWWNDEQHANPDTEVLDALRPAMFGVPGALLLCISSPYRRKGAMFQARQRWWGRDRIQIGEQQLPSRVLFWNAATWDMRPIDQELQLFLDEEKYRDPSSFASEYGAQYRSDLEDYLSLEQVQACVISGRSLMPYEAGKTYYAFLDTAGGGGQDSAALAIGHAYPKDKGRFGVAVDRVIEWRPTFDAEDTADAIAKALKEYRINTIRGDNFSGDTWASMLRKRGLSYQVETLNATALYRTALPIFTGHNVELPDPEANQTIKRMVNQLTSLEKREGGEKIDHPKNGHDDIANALAGLLCLAYKKPDQGVVVTSVTRSWTPDGTKGEGVSYQGEGRFRVVRNGEVEFYRDPRFD